MQTKSWIAILFLLRYGNNLLTAQVVKEVKSKTGLYFDEIGTISFYPTQWRVVTYINLTPSKELWKNTKNHFSRVKDYCKKQESQPWYHLTDCQNFGQYMVSKSKQIDQLKDIIAQYISTESSDGREKRGILNFVGEVEKVLFGTLTEADADTYNAHISELEKRQKDFLHVAKEQMLVIKSTILNVNQTIQKVNVNEQKLKENLELLASKTGQDIQFLKDEIINVNFLNEQFRLIQRGIEESQHAFEIIVDALVHAETGAIQPQLMTPMRVKQMLRREGLPSGLEYPHFPFSELQKIILPTTYSYKNFLVYVLNIPLLSPTQYHLYKLLPFPSKQQDALYHFIDFHKEFIFSDSMHQHYGKLTSNELQLCFQPNEFHFVCKEEIPLYTYVQGMDCEASLLHPSTQKVPGNCNLRIIKLEHTFWIPLYKSNQWIYVSPQEETFTILCPSFTQTIKISDTGILTLLPGCKGYSPYVTLYAMQIKDSNSSNDVVPIAEVNFDCCFDENKNADKNLNIPVHVPLVDVLSSQDDLRLASIKAEEIDKLITEEEQRTYNYWYTVTSSWTLTLSWFIIIGIVLCCCCYCQCCRDCFWKFWKLCTPGRCVDQCTNMITNTITVNQPDYFSARFSRSRTEENFTGEDTAVIETQPIRSSVSLTSLTPEPKESNETDSIAKRTRSRRFFR